MRSNICFSNSSKPRWSKNLLLINVYHLLLIFVYVHVFSIDTSVPGFINYYVQNHQMNHLDRVCRVLEFCPLNSLDGFIICLEKLCVKVIWMNIKLCFPVAIETFPLLSSVDIKNQVKNQLILPLTNFSYFWSLIIINSNT